MIDLCSHLMLYCCHCNVITCGQKSRKCNLPIKCCCVFQFAVSFCALMGAHTSQAQKSICFGKCTQLTPHNVIAMRVSVAWMLRATCVVVMWCGGSKHIPGVAALQNESMQFCFLRAALTNSDGGDYQFAVTSSPPPRQRFSRASRAHQPRD
jgi:hypothetical protein